jgi:hypothetical protein
MFTTTLLTLVAATHMSLESPQPLPVHLDMVQQAKQELAILFKNDMDALMIQHQLVVKKDIKEASLLRRETSSTVILMKKVAISEE